MIIVLLSVVGFAAAMLGMAAGVILGGRALRGSCGGIAADCSCSAVEALRCERRGKT